MLDILIDVVVAKAEEVTVDGGSYRVGRLLSATHVVPCRDNCKAS